MAKIRIQHRFGTDSIGTGWANKENAARAFADLLMDVWSEDLQVLVDAGHEYHMNVSVAREASIGSTTSIEVTECEAGLESYQIEQLVEAALTDSNLVFDHFCRADEFGYLAVA